MEALRQQLGAIVPRLYRSRFSPDPKTRIAMHRLWESLVGKKSKKTIDKYFGKIITLTLPALADPQWREREAACEALNDLLSIGRKAVEVLPYLDTLWESAMKVADDIKETVAVAAVKLLVPARRAVRAPQRPFVVPGLAVRRKRRTSHAEIRFPIWPSISPFITATPRGGRA